MAADPLMGPRIRKRRQILGMTQQELAGQLSVSKSTVANWENGKHFPLRYLGALEFALGISLTGEARGPVIHPDLRAAIWATLPPDAARRTIAFLERTLVVSGSGEPAAGDEAQRAVSPPRAQ